MRSCHFNNKKDLSGDHVVYAHMRGEQNRQHSPFLNVAFNKGAHSIYANYAVA